MYSEHIQAGVRVHASQDYTKAQRRINLTPKNTVDPSGVNVLQPFHLFLLLPWERDYRSVSAEGVASLRGCSYVRISHYRCACSTGHILCQFFWLPKGKLTQAIPKLLAQRGVQFSF